MRQVAWGAHRRLAIAIGLWVVVQSLTGLILLFGDPIEHLTQPGLTHHGKGDLGATAALDAVRRRFPGEEVGVLSTPAVSDGVYVVEMGEREVYVDPARARINGVRDHDAGFLALVRRIHRRFLFDSILGLPGVRLVALLGAAWLGLALTGLTTGAAGRVHRWWQRGVETGQCPGDRGCPPDRPGGRRFPPVQQRPLPAGSRRTPHVLHRTIGFVVVVPMVVVVATGIRLAVPAGSDRLWAAVTGSGQASLDRAPDEVRDTSDDRGGNPLNATDILAALDRKYPDGQVARLLMPASGDRRAPVIAGVSLGLDPGRGQHDYGGNTVVFVDQYSADTLWEGRPDALPVARQAALLWTRPLHTGSFAGTMGTMVWGWAAVAVVALGASGYATRRSRILEDARQRRWVRQRRRRRSRSRWQPVGTVRAARDTRRTRRRLRRRSRHLRRRREVQARLGIRVPDQGAEPDAPELPVEIDLTDDIEIDLTDGGVEIDLTDAAILYESEITLESGDTLETGIVGPPPPD